MRYRVSLVIPYVLLFVSLLTFAGCGGGGGGGGPNSPFKLLSTNPGAADVDEVQTAFTDAGRGIAVWVADSDFEQRLLASIYNPTTDAWSNEIELVRGGIYESFEISLVGGPSEVALLFTIGQGLYATTFSGGTFATPVKLDQASDPKYGINDVSLVRFGSGFGAAWRRLESRDPVTFDATYTAVGSTRSAGTGWSTPTVLGPTGDIRRVRAASDGTSFMVAFIVDGGLFGNWFFLGSWQSNAREIDERVEDVNEAVIATSGTGYQVAWIQNDGTANSVLTAGFNAIFTMTSVAVADSSSDATHDVSILSNETNYLLAWRQGDPRDLMVSLGSGIIWSVAVALDEPSLDEEVRDDFHLASNGTGYAASWSQEDSNGHLSRWASVYTGLWTPAVVLETSDGYVMTRDPALISNGNGYLAVWGQTDSTSSTNRSAWSNTYSSGAWGGAVPLETGTGSTGDVYPTARGADYVVAWPQWAPDDSSVAVGVREKASGTGTWGAPLNLVGVLRGSSAYPESVLGNAAGAVLAAWYQSQGQSGQHYAAVRDASGVWGAPQRIWSGNQDQIATDGTGFAVAGYEGGMDGPATSIEVQRYVGQAWTSGEDPAGGAFTGAVQSAAIASNGSGYGVAWVQRPTPTASPNAYGSIFDGTAWSTPVELSAGGDVQSIRITSNGTGYAVTWDTISDGTVPVNVYDGTSWSGLEVVSTPSNQTFPRVDSNGTGYVVHYNTYDSGVGGSVNFAIVSPTGAAADFGAEVRVSSPARPAGQAEFATNGTGYAMVWAESNAVDEGYLMGSVFDGTDWSAPTRLNSVDQRVSRIGIASDGAGYGVAWRQRDTAEDDPSTLMAIVYSSGAWGIPTALETTDDPVDEYAEGGRRIASDGTGYKVAWSRMIAAPAGDGRWHINVSSYDGASWTASQIESRTADAISALLDASGGTYALVLAQPDPAGDPLVLLPWAWVGSL